MRLFSKTANSFTDSDIDQLAKLINQSQHTYAITGAGISTAAGIPDL